MEKSTFSVPQTDCGAVEQLIRVKLENLSAIGSLDFDLAGRTLHIFHQ